MIVIASLTALSTTASARVVGGPDNAAGVSTKRPTPTADPSSAVAGTTTVVSGVQCIPDTGPTTVFVSLVDSSGNVIASASVLPPPDGNWQLPLTVPTNVKAGKYQIDSTCDSYYSEFYYPSAPFTVTAAGASPWSIQNTASVKGPNGDAGAISCWAASACMAVGTHLNGSGLDVPISQVSNGTKWVNEAVPVPKGGESYGVGGVSCVAVHSCVAVGNYVEASGRQVTLAWIWDGTKWAVSSPSNPVGGSSDVLSSVSCSTVDLCAAVGSYMTDVADQFQSVALAESWDGATWSIQSVPTPSGAASSAFALDSVSCTSAGICAAVGWDGPYYAEYDSQQLVAQWNGATWTSATLPPLTDSFEAMLTSISCSAATTCVAVGNVETYSGQAPLVENLNGTTWTNQAAATVSTGPTTFSAVSCPSTTSCTAVGTEDDYATDAVVPLAEAWNGAAWTVQKVPSPKHSMDASLVAVSCPASGSCWATGAYSIGTLYSSGPALPFAATLGAGTWSLGKLSTETGEGGNSLSSVSCATATACEAVGSAEAPSGYSIPQAQVWNGTNWSAQSIAGPSGSLSSWLIGVSCAAANSCIAIGGFENSSFMDEPYAQQWNGADWTDLTVTVPGDSQVANLTSVSCSAADSCEAIGSYEDTTTYQDVLLAEHWNGASWTGSTISTFEPGTYGQLDSISCTTSDACVAVGNYVSYDPIYDSGPLVETLSGSSWSQAEITNAGLSASLYAVACTSSTACTAVGSQSAGQAEVPLAEVWTGGSWTAQSPANGGTGGVLTDVSCTSANSCTAVGSASNYGYPNEAPIAETWNGISWILPAMPVLPDAATGALVSVSCVSSGVCAAVGSMSPGDVLAVGEGGA
jgi:hypothetical protein